MARTTDLTTGKLWKNLILFAIPLLLSSLVQQLYNTVDLIFVGNFIDKSASAAIGASSLLITCLVGFFGGMSVGSGVVVSHIFGARDKSEPFQSSS
ncbi:MAG: MATE family efflux transporter [Lachnospiraceae bacterium]